MYTSSSIPNSYLGKCTYILVKFYRSVGQFGRPLALGARSRMFDSCHSDLQELSCNVHSLQGVVSNSEKDTVQSRSDRSILVIQTDDTTYNNAYEQIRFVSGAYLSSVGKNTYWGDSEYGKSKLENVLKLGSLVMKDGKLSNKVTITNEYVGSVTKMNNEHINIEVNYFKSK